MNCGKVCLPAEFRQKLGIEPKNNLTMILDSNRIILEKGLEVDMLGRIQIPLNIRQALQIQEKEELTIELVENKIILTKK